MQISRRNLMTGTAALALAGPAVAVASPGRGSDLVDPALDAARDWLASHDAAEQTWALGPTEADAAYEHFETNVMEAAWQAQTDAGIRLGATAATTPLGLAAKAAVALWEYRRGRFGPGNPDYDVGVLMGAAEDAVALAGYDAGETEDDAITAIRAMVGAA